MPYGKGETSGFVAAGSTLTILINSLDSMRYIIGTGDKKPKAKYSVNILGEYNIGADAWGEDRILMLSARFALIIEASYDLLAKDRI